MTKKHHDTKHQDPKHQDPSAQEDTSLEEALKKVQQEKLDEELASDKEQEASIQEKVALLEREKNEALDIARKVQYDYLNLKTDFDRLQRLSLEKEKSMETDTLIKYMKKIFPIIDQLKASLDHADQTKEDDVFVQGVKMIYDNMIKTLASFSIYPIEALGLVPDSLLHEPLSTLPVEDETQKGKIVQVFQQWFYIEKNWEKTVIIPSKVIVWA
jgi:molecular chaperone GrpE